jgi:hypothetical protein
MGEEWYLFRERNMSPCLATINHAEKRFHALALRKVYDDQMLNYIRHEQVEIATPTDGTEETYDLLHHLSAPYT